MSEFLRKRLMQAKRGRQVPVQDRVAAKEWGVQVKWLRALARLGRLACADLTKSPRAPVCFTKYQVQKLDPAKIRRACEALALFRRADHSIDHLRAKCRFPLKGSVYFISDGHAIKIGYAISVPMRVREMQCGNPRTLTVLGTTVGSQELEKLIHAQFGALRIRGEWFKDTKTLRRFIEAIGVYDAAVEALYDD